ncbi:MAG TPA: NAD-dependent epimerase/dehydratase family protein [Longimicrobiales bacterium]|nr:NAD-dependent epimerase/dehydratase family protein [Longimicrobiales bacterium]
MQSQRIFIAGATGVLGRRLVRLLTERGHQVTGMTRTASKRGMLEQLGATPVVADALDASAVGTAISEAEPDVVVHQLTDLAHLRSMRNFDRSFAGNARLRREGTDILLSASRAAGVRRFVAQCYGGFLFPEGGTRADVGEDDPLDPAPHPTFRAALAADRHLERVVTGATWMDGVALRYGAFYGPGTSMSLEPPGVQSEMVRRRQYPIVGDGAGYTSFIHIDDAAAATVAAIEHGRPGIYQVADDEPARASEWLPALAQVLGARPPMRLPVWLARIMAGPAVVEIMTRASGVSNAKARRELDWQPVYSSWRAGFAHGLR